MAQPTNKQKEAINSLLVFSNGATMREGEYDRSLAGAYFDHSAHCAARAYRQYIKACQWSNEVHEKARALGLI